MTSSRRAQEEYVPSPLQRLLTTSSIQNCSEKKRQSHWQKQDSNKRFHTKIPLTTLLGYVDSILGFFRSLGQVNGLSYVS